MILLLGSNSFPKELEARRVHLGMNFISPSWRESQQLSPLLHADFKAHFLHCARELDQTLSLQTSTTSHSTNQTRELRRTITETTTSSHPAQQRPRRPPISAIHIPAHHIAFPPSCQPTTIWCATFCCCSPDKTPTHKTHGCATITAFRCCLQLILLSQKPTTDAHQKCHEMLRGKKRTHALTHGIAGEPSRRSSSSSPSTSTLELPLQQNPPKNLP